MERINPQQLRDAILNAPGWARVGLTMPDLKMREKAATEIAVSIVERLEDHPGTPDPDQFNLPI